jgi:hypothetical protein
MIDTITVVIVLILVYLFINKQLIIFAIVGIGYFMQSSLIGGGGGDRTLLIAIDIIKTDDKILTPELTKTLFNRSVINVTQVGWPQTLRGNKPDIRVIYQHINILLRDDIMYNYVMVTPDQITKCLPDVLRRTKNKLIIYSKETIETDEILDFNYFRNSKDFETKFINDGKIITIKKNF